MTPDSARRNDPLLGRVIDDKYALEQKLGEGGMSLVYRATHAILNRPVAVKVLRVDEDPSGECAERLAREARTLAQLESSHIVGVLDCGRLDSGEPYLVLEYLTGETLAARLERLGPFGLEGVCRLALQVIDGLAEAHSKGVVHRDLKPENLFLALGPGGDEQVKLLDFGISKQVSAAERVGTGVRPGVGRRALQSAPWTRLTQPHVCVGSPQYMAPEQVLCGPVDTRVDVWGLGVVLYELSTGALPFDGASLAEVCARIVQATPAPPSDHAPELPKSFDALVLKCLHKSAAARPQHVTEVAAELRRLLRDADSQRATKTLRLRRKPARARRWLLAAFAVGALVPIILGLPLNWQRGPALSAAREASLLSWPRSAAAEPAAAEPAAAEPAATKPATGTSTVRAATPPRPRPRPAPRSSETMPPAPADLPHPPLVDTQRSTARRPPVRPSRSSHAELAVPRSLAHDDAVGAAPIAPPDVDAHGPDGVPEFGGRF